MELIFIMMSVYTMIGSSASYALDDKNLVMFVAVDHISRVLTSERVDLTPPLLDEEARNASRTHTPRPSY
jgi:hypothetical protein